MVTGQQLVDWCVGQRGHPYSWTNRFGPDNFDCSGLITAACWAHGLEPTGFNSTGLEIWCRDNDLSIDIAAARDIPGALVFVWGYGAQGHVSMSMGDGRLIETPSAEGHMVGISDFWRHGWTGAALIPGVIYGDPPPEPEPELSMDHSIWNAVTVQPDGVHAYAVSGSSILFEYVAEPRGELGIPQAAIDSGLLHVRVDDKVNGDGTTGWDRLLKVN